MRLAAVVLGVALGACYMGYTAESFAPAAGPRGIAADLRLSDRNGRVRGELLAVEDTALVVLPEGGHSIRVRIADIAQGAFDRIGLLIEAGRASRRGLERLRLLSRFPAGLPPEFF